MVLSFSLLIITYIQMKPWRGCRPERANGAKGGRCPQFAGVCARAAKEERENASSHGKAAGEEIACEGRHTYVIGYSEEEYSTWPYNPPAHIYEKSSASCHSSSSFMDDVEYSRMDVHGELVVYEWTG